MPGLDRTGPQGDGPMTGRGMGRCNPDNRDSDDQGRGRGFGRGFGRGNRRGQGRGFGNGNRNRKQNRGE